MNGAVVCLHRLEYRLQRRTSAHRGVYPSIALERLAIEHLDGYGTHPLDKLENSSSAGNGVAPAKQQPISAGLYSK